jgi:hypothetical protein
MRENGDLRRRGIPRCVLCFCAQAWVGAFDSALERFVAAEDERLKRET